MAAVGVVDGPIVQAHTQVKHPGIHARKIKIEAAGERFALKHHVVAKQISMHRAARQGCISSAGSDLVLVGQFLLQQIQLLRTQMRVHLRRRFVLPRQAAQIGLLHGKVLPRHMHARQQITQLGAMHRLRLQLACAPQFIDNRGRFAAKGEQNFPRGIGLRLGYRNAPLGQMLHQIQIKRQLLVAQTFKQREHIFALIGGGKVIGVFDAAGNAAQLLQLANVQLLEQITCRFQRHLGKYSHGELFMHSMRRTGACCWGQSQCVSLWCMHVVCAMRLAPFSIEGKAQAIRPGAA